VASVTSSTHERKSKTNIVTKHGRLLLKHNAFTCVGGASISSCGVAEGTCTQAPYRRNKRPPALPPHRAARLAAPLLLSCAQTLACFPICREDVNIVAVMPAMGVESDEEVLQVGLRRRRAAFAQ